MIKTYANKTLLKAISMALNHSLYIPGFELKNTLEGSIGFIQESLDDGEPINIKIGLFFDKEIPVAIIFTTYNNETQIFVKEEYRRKGIATALSRKMHKMVDKPLNVYEGIEESTLFFNTLDFLVQN